MGVVRWRQAIVIPLFYDDGRPSSPATLDPHPLLIQTIEFCYQIIVVSMARYRCNICDRDFFSWDALDQHNSAVHRTSERAPRRSQQDQFECDNCDRDFYSRDALDQHNSAVHRTSQRALRQSHQGLFECDDCDRDFYSRDALDQHNSAVHPTYRPTRTRNPPRIAAHRPQFSCSICRKDFVNEYALDQHLVSDAHPEDLHGGRRRSPAPVYKCDECGRTFDVKDMLTLHAVNHVTERLRGW
ncbi:hypothetical protein Q9L58_008306 [Maublancomyces gigas]|uniref:C2H2-type domain-containing protein n=1 Tax=Discina gigas TaxID=1032678 RepID=A0ABR3GA18_9PEZI